MPLPRSGDILAILCLARDTYTLACQVDAAVGRGGEVGGGGVTIENSGSGREAEFRKTPLSGVLVVTCGRSETARAEETPLICRNDIPNRGGISIPIDRSD